jgi:hypothetical protein
LSVLGWIDAGGADESGGESPAEARSGDFSAQARIIKDLGV